MSGKNINIRLENRSDYRNVENLTREALSVLRTDLITEMLKI